MQVIYNEIYQLPEIYRGAFAAVIGRVKKEPKFRVLFDGMPVCDASIDAITSGIRYNRPQTSRAIENNEADFPMESPEDLFETVMLMAEGPHISSREPIFRQYDTEVQGNTVIRAGEADAGVISPIPGNPVGIAFSIDGNPRYCRLNPYMGAAAAVAEGFRNVAAVGAYPVCITDCLNFGNPEDPIVMHQFTESLRGISDACRLIYQKDRREEPVPVVSGNVSFYNQSASGKAVAPSPIIATYGILEDYSIAVDMKLKNPGNPVFLLGTRKNELGGSVYLLEKYHIRNRGTVPRIDFEEERKRNLLVANSIEKGLVTAAHDISDGGLLVCAMEMCSDKRNIGISIEISKIPDGLRPDIFLFTETPGFLLEVASSAEDSFIRKAKTVGVDFERIGRTTEDGKAVFDIDGYTLPPIDVKKIYEITSSGLKKHIF
jgi:phosphoribosylformylglycinamidine synthase